MLDSTSLAAATRGWTPTQGCRDQRGRGLRGSDDLSWHRNWLISGAAWWRTHFLKKLWNQKMDPHRFLGVQWHARDIIMRKDVEVNLAYFRTKDQLCNVYVVWINLFSPEPPEWKQDCAARASPYQSNNFLMHFPTLLTVLVSLLNFVFKHQSREFFTIWDLKRWGWNEMKELSSYH